MRRTRAPGRLRPFAVLAALLVIGSAADGEAAAQARHAPDTFTATTTAMTPAGIKLEIQVQEWSNDEARDAVLSALQDAAPTATALAALPTVGYVWRSDSSVGYSVKYAYREAAADGAEQVTVVTGEPLDKYSFRRWKVAGASAEKTYDYSVIELRLDARGRGAGTLSLAADVVFDERAHTVSLAHAAAAPSVLTDVEREPKPYGAR